MNLLDKYKNTEYKKEIKDTLWVMCLQGLNYVAPILVLPYLMVVLGAEKFGYYGFALAACQWLMLFVDFGFNLSATKRIAVARGNQSETNQIFTGTVFAKVFLLALSFCVLLILMLIPQFAIYRKAMALMFTMVIGQTFFFVFLFQGIGKVRWIAIINGIAKVSVLPLTFILVKEPNDYDTAIILQGMVSVVAAMISITMIIKNRWVKIIEFKTEYIKTEIKESWPLFLSQAATSIYTALFIIILGFFATAEEVGQYSAADKLMRAMCYLILLPILQVFYPKISQMATTNRAAAESLAKKLFKVTLGLMTIISCILFCGADWILNALGKDYNGATSVLKIMAFVPLFVGMSGILGQCYLLALGKNGYSKKYFEHTYFIAGGTSITAVLALTPILHAVGTAIALLITEMVVVILMGKGRRLI